jgi:hypothetical protein
MNEKSCIIKINFCLNKWYISEEDDFDISFSFHEIISITFLEEDENYHEQVIYLMRMLLALK